jgi:hypothetical protein
VRRHARKLAPPLVAFAVTLAALAPSIYSSSQHPDEAQYAWSAGYVGGLIARGELRADETRSFSDPGWYPGSYWNKTQPMGTRFLYAGVMGVTRVSPPARPYSFTDRTAQGPETFASARTLTVLRWTATLCAALGLALLALRLGWRGVGIASVMVAVPGFREDLSRAWAEGPLVLGFGLVAVALRSRALPIALGLAATAKLTALGLWPLMLVKRVNGGMPRLRALLLTLLTFIVLTPPSWAAGGPLFLVGMVVNRVDEYSGQSETEGGLFMPTRYGIPFVLGALVVIAIALPHAAAFARSRGWRLPLVAGLRGRPA